MDVILIFCCIINIFMIGFNIHVNKSLPFALVSAGALVLCLVGLMS